VFWLVVVFELPAGGHKAKTFYFYFFISLVCCPEQRDTPRTHVDDAAVNAAPLQVTTAAAAAAASCPIRPRPARCRVPPPNPRPLHFRLVGGHQGVSARQLEQGAPRRIPRLHCLMEQAAAARRAYQQLGCEGPTAGHGLVEGGAMPAGPPRGERGCGCWVGGSAPH